MNRTTVAALVTTAVIGVSAGAVTAVVRGQDPADPSSGPRTTHTPSSGTSTGTTHTQAPTARPAVLWAEPGKVHDGARVVEDAGMPQDVPDRLVRAQGGYVLVFDTSPQEPSRALWFLSEKGNAKHLGDALDAWDLNAAGDTVAFPRLSDGKLVAVGTDGTQKGAWAGPTGRVGLVWHGDDVEVSALDIEVGGWLVSLWTPATGAHRQTNQAGMENIISTRDGSRVLGSVGVEGSAASSDNHCLQQAPFPGLSGKSWFTCDWRLNWAGHNPVSPDGRRMLVVDAQSDGFGPGAFGIVDLAQGPRAGVPVNDAPREWMTDGAWVTSDSYAVVGSNGDEVGKSGGWVELCKTTGECQEVAKTTTGKITLGEPF